MKKDSTMVKYQGVVETLIPGLFKEPKEEINHKDGNTFNNSIDNLEVNQSNGFWKDLKDYENSYEISLLGKIRKKM